MSRVLEYDNPLATDTAADRVFGQGGSFTSGTCNLGGISASSLSVAPGTAAMTSSWPLCNGSTGSTIAGSSAQSVTSRPRSTKQRATLDPSPPGLGLDESESPSNPGRFSYSGKIGRAHV